MMETVPALRGRGRPRTRDAALCRDAVVERAFEAFIELGFAGTTTGLVAARSRVSKRTIYELFSGKAGLFAAVVAKHQTLLLNLPRPDNEDIPMLSVLISVFRLDMDAQRDREREALLNLILRESVQTPGLADFLYDGGSIRLREALIDWLGQEIARGRLPVVDAELCAGMLMDIVFGALLPRRREAGDEARNQRKQHIKQRLEIFLRGIGPARPALAEASAR